MKLPICVILLGVMVALCIAHIGGGHIMQDIDLHVHCGRNLAIVISELCVSQIPEKKSEVILYGASIPTYYKEQEYGWPWISAHKARSLALPSRGKRLISGVADECCNKPCTIDEMLNYCV